PVFFVRNISFPGMRRKQRDLYNLLLSKVISMKPLLRPLALAALLAGCATQRPDNQVELTLVGLNDLHGHLEASRFNDSVKAGGIDAVAATVQAWRKDDPD